MKKNKTTGWIGTLAVHAALFLLLWMVAIRKPQAQEEGGVPVLMGQVESAYGISEPYTLTDVDIMNEPETADAMEEQVQEPADAEMITQEEEPTVVEQDFQMDCRLRLSIRASRMPRLRERYEQLALETGRIRLGDADEAVGLF